MLVPLLLQHVAPELSNANGFVRSRACWTIQQYASMCRGTDDAMQSMLTQLLERLHDPDMPVRVQAWMAVRPLLDHPLRTCAARGCTPASVGTARACEGETRDRGMCRAQHRYSFADTRRLRWWTRCSFRGDGPCAATADRGWVRGVVRAATLAYFRARARQTCCG